MGQKMEEEKSLPVGGVERGMCHPEITSHVMNFFYKRMLIVQSEGFHVILP
jgi:hypothetical protein